MPPIRRQLLCALLVSLVPLLSTSCSRQSNKERALNLANTYFASGELDKAEIEYLNTLRNDPANVRAIAQLGLIYAEQGRIGQAPAYLLKARALQPENIEVRAKLAVFLLAAKKHDEVRTEARYVLTHQPDHAEAPLLLAESAQTPQDQADVKEFLQKLPNAKSAPVLTALANLEFRQRKLPEAEALLVQARALDPKSSTANASLGSVYLAKKDLLSAETAFSAAWENAPARSPMKLSYVRFKLQTADAEGAKRLLAALSARIPDTLPPMMLLAEIFIKEKKYAEALALTAKMVESDPSHLPALLLSVRLRLALGQADKALPELERLKATQSTIPELHYLFAQTHLALGDAGKAAASLHQAIELAPNYVEAILLLAEINLKKGDALIAGTALKTLLARHPELLPAKSLLARTYVSQGDLVAALTTYQEIAAASPQDPSFLIPIALIYRQQKNPTQARSILARALDLNSNFGPAIELLVDLDLSAGDPTSARKHAEGLRARQPDKTDAHMLLAKINLLEKKFTQAEADLLKVIELQPDTSAAYYMLAGIYTQTHQEKKALEQLEQVAPKNPKNPALQLRIALLQERLKNYPAAREAYEKVLAVEPKFLTALNNLAYLYAEQFHDTNRGLILAQKAREQAPSDPNIADTFGWILYQQGQYQRARALLLESAAKLPEEAVIQYHLGSAHYMMGEAEAARTSLQRALQLNPELPDKILINQRLALLANDLNRPEPGLRATLEKIVAEQKNDPVALTQLGEVLLQAGEAASAQAALTSALALNPLNVPAALGLIRAHLARHDTTQAFALAKATRKQAPNDPAVGHQLGRIAFQLGDHQWAASLLQDSARKLPDDPAVMFDHAKADYSIGRVANAQEVMNRILQATPNTPNAAEISSYLAMIALTSQPAPESTAKIEQALADNPTFVPALMALGANAEKQSNRTAARQAYEKVIAKYPDFSPAKKNLALIAAATDTNEPNGYDVAVQAREAFPNDPEIAQALGILTYRKGDFNRAASLLKESIARNGEDARRTYYLGLAQYKLSDKAARTTLKKSLELGLKENAAAEAKRIIAELN